MTSMYMVSGQKCGGATTFALNLSLQLSSSYQNAKVACLQFEYFPDMHVYCGLEKYQPLSDLFEFQKTKDWNESLLHRFAHKQGSVDVFFAPNYEGDKGDRRKFIDLLLKTYDIIVINIDHTKIHPWGALFQEYVKRIFYITTLSPTSLVSLPKGLSLYEDFGCVPEIILNQVHKREVKKVSSLFKERNLPAPILCLPFDEDSFWEQAFKAVPPVCRKKSIWGKSFRQFCHNSCSHA